MKHTVVIKAPAGFVFEQLSTPSARETWTKEIESIRYEHPPKEKAEGAAFIQIQKEGAMRTSFHGKNVAVIEPETYSYSLESKAFKMVISYHLEDLQGETKVTQTYEVIYLSTFAKIMGKLSSKLTEKLAQALVQQLKRYCEDALTK
ncbi:SRPBCC family protein [Metabacillus idriensis]|uniref:SRPBCC family protein n=1 Tax=Metabacillus idriensis TaxID=324768 RepID=UPI00281369F8|nr:SRPBCC family protein [Metabacillus idriensis]MDR0138649.1 SRPBCC family protein [Metabacillus idriensis]